jgi:hypothetical protein
MLNHDRQWWGSILAALYLALTSRSCVGYRWDDSDGWIQARAPQEATTPYRHLECWIDLGDRQRAGSQTEHTSRLVYAVRYQPDNDDVSQGIAQASVSDVAELLTSWTGPGDSRTSFNRATMTADAAGWLVVVVEFTLRYPWRS